MTQGLTSKVVFGSAWTFAGHVLPLAVSLISTPIVIRLLGAEAYGVLILIGLIPNYLAFADLGMGVASTKFGAEELGRNNPEGEGSVVKVAAALAVGTALTIALVLFAFSGPLMTGWFRVPESLETAAVVGLQITCLTFVLTVLTGVVNTPMLTRLRMDLNVAATALPKILLGVVTPIVIFLGGHIIGATIATLFIAAFSLTLTILLSYRLLPEMMSAPFDTRFLRPMLRFGGGWIVAMLASILLVNLEKFFLPRFVSVEALAYYSVAFTFANMATMFSWAMNQSLVPAFASLKGAGDMERFDALLARGLRLMAIVLPPIVTVLVVIAKPFFTVWAGPEFGLQSSGPFYILTVGLFLNFFAFVPYSILTALGRSDVLAKLYWFEFLIYGVAAYYLISSFGILGAAVAWSLRVGIDAVLLFMILRRLGHRKFGGRAVFSQLFLSIMVLSPPVVFAAAVGGFSWALVPITGLSLLVYGAASWFRGVNAEEKEWLVRNVRLFMEKRGVTGKSG